MSENIIDVDGMVYGSDESIVLRQEVIKLRDDAMMRNTFNEAVMLSHLISWMAQVIHDKWNIPIEQMNT